MAHLYFSTLSVVIFWLMVQKHKLYRTAIVAGGFFVYILYYVSAQIDRIAREKLLALTILIVFTIIFWALFEQAYTSLNLFKDRVLDRGNIAAVVF